MCVCQEEEGTTDRTQLCDCGGCFAAGAFGIRSGIFPVNAHPAHSHSSCALAGLSVCKVCLFCNAKGAVQLAAAAAAAA